MKLTDSQKRIYDVLNRTNLTDRDKAILISQIQEKLVSGENISTINGEDITKGGNIEIQGGGGSNIVFKGNYNEETNPAATIQDVKDEISKESYDNLQTDDKTIIGAINEVNTEIESAVEPYVVNLTNLLAADDSESISTAIGGIDNLNGTVQKNQVIFGTLANGTVAVGIRVLGNQTTLTYFVDSVVGLTVNEVIITNTSGTLSKTANTHAVLTENMVVNSLDSDETTLPLSAAQGKHLGRLLNISIQYRSIGRITDNSEIEEILGITASELRNYRGPKSGRLVVVEQSAPNMADAAYERVFYSVRYQSASHSSNWTFIPITDTLNTYKRCTVSIERSSDQFSSLDIDKGSITDLQNLDKAIGQPAIMNVDLSTLSEVGYFWNVNGTKTASSSWNISKSITLSKGDLLIITNLSASTITSVITAVSNTGDFIDSLVAANGAVRGHYSYMADKDCTVQLSYSSITSAYIVKSSQNTAIADIVTSTAALHKIYESYGAVYNAETGYWELNGLTDLTEEDMWDIYLAGVPKTNDLTEFYANERSIRTTFNCRIKGGSTGKGTILRGTFMQCANLEVVHFNKSKGSIINLRELSMAFYNCQKLREIGDILAVYISELLTDNTFYNCKALKSVKLSRLRTDISFKDSPLLSYESIKYLVDNAANTAAITVTVHPTTYSYLTGTAQPTEDVGGTTEEWQALVTTAQGKQISFAVPEETQSEVTE